MFHLKGSWLAQNLVPYVERAADSEPGIAGRGLDVDLFERSVGKDFSVGHAVVCHTARQAEVFYGVKFMKPVEHRMHGFFKPRLQRGGDIPVAPLDRLIRLVCRGQAVL